MPAAELYSLGQKLLDRLHTAAVRPSFHSFGRSARLCRPFRLEGAAGISLGARVYIGPGSWLATRPSGDSGPVLRLDDHVEIAGQVVLSAVENVWVETGVLMARGVYISDHSHAFSDPDVAIKDQGIDAVSAVRIGAGAWLGQNVVVLPGVEIGPGAVVAANSVVRSSVPARTVVAGAPARVVRRLDGRG